jgi:hypothetical protein
MVSDHLHCAFVVIWWFKRISLYSSHVVDTRVVDRTIVSERERTRECCIYDLCPYWWHSYSNRFFNYHNRQRTIQIPHTLLETGWNDSSSEWNIRKWIEKRIKWLNIIWRSLIGVSFEDERQIISHWGLFKLVQSTKHFCKLIRSLTSLSTKE